MILVVEDFTGELGTVGGECEDQDTAEIESILNETELVVVYASSAYTVIDLVLLIYIPACSMARYEYLMVLSFLLYQMYSR